MEEGDPLMEGNNVDLLRGINSALSFVAVMLKHSILNRRRRGAIPTTTLASIKQPWYIDMDVIVILMFAAVMVKAIKHICLLKVNLLDEIFFLAMDNCYTSSPITTTDG